ncbi:hypothetical protein EDB82DRAFT_99636 [Fusarium venenatum]|uniref:uncharacterized protein n=1 Tax=Fusarium venenatum TaxID=56646 RepID=UPI001D4B5165|nr:hypothetical protein EDB82DRAFT_99636 [Fusarium venenatum]
MISLGVGNLLGLFIIFIFLFDLVVFLFPMLDPTILGVQCSTWNEIQEPISSSFVVTFYFVPLVGWIL